MFEAGIQYFCTEVYRGGYAGSNKNRTLGKLDWEVWFLGGEEESLSVFMQQAGSYLALHPRRVIDY